LDEERSGFSHANFSKVSDVIVCGLNVRYVRLEHKTGLFGALIKLRHMGLVSAVHETTLALNVFQTKVLCMSGICAGFSSRTSLGQLVIASPAWEYQAGKWSENGFEIAPAQIPLRPATRAIIDQVVSRPGFVSQLESDDGLEGSRPPQQTPPILAPFGTGSAVIADSARLKHVQVQHRKVAALDMEAFGVYYASHESSFPVEHFFCVKCVVDMADATKADDLHQYGCTISARATEQIIRALFGS
jgi:nucleoside phosphorylase